MPQSSSPSPIFPPDRLAELREDMDYPLKEEVDVETTDDLDWFDWLNDLDFSLTDTSTILPLVLILLGLGYVIYRILGDVSLRRRTRDPNEEEKIVIGDLEEERMVAEGVELSLLERAERTGQYDVAVRLLYIQLLKELQDASLIKYRRDYSNRDYQHQLGQSDFLPAFRNVTTDYERYWFGKYLLDRLSYRLTSRKFRELSAGVRASARPQTDDYV